MSPESLDFYREKSKFDSAKFKNFLESEELVQSENEFAEKFSSFISSNNEMALDEKRKRTWQIFVAANEILKELDKEPLQNLIKLVAVFRIVSLIDSSAGAKLGAYRLLFLTIIRTLGNIQQIKMAENIEANNFLGAFCMTEIGHGSNLKGLQTRATFDKETGEFILHTPDFYSAKCWAGLLGQSASYAVVFAQLYLDNVHYGLQAFIVPIRDPKTLIPYSGVFIGDMGEKIGLNGVDNGFMMFEKYRIPRNYLLSDTYEVTTEGEFQTFRETDFNMIGALTVLISGRFNVADAALLFARRALTIAIRYAAVRKQFGPEEDKEVSILEYQTHQFRLLPALSQFFVMSYFMANFRQVMYKLLSQKEDSVLEMGKEAHIISAAIKPTVTWFARDAIQECREACGGHGYLKAATFGDIRNDNDVNCTYEGDNFVLLQQTSNWLLKFWPKIKKMEKISSPLKSVNFLSKTSDILKLKFDGNNHEEVGRPENILKMYQWLICYLLQKTNRKLNDLKSKQNGFWAKNNIQIFYAKDLATAYMHHFLLLEFLNAINTAPDVHIQGVLVKIFSLYGLSTLQQFLPLFYEGGYTTGSKPNILIKESILKLCNEIKEDAVSLADVIAPPDILLNSVLGVSNGNVYECLQTNFMQNSYNTERPVWWQDIVAGNKHLMNKL